jgi:O-antigen ligase
LENVWPQRKVEKETLAGAFFWLSAFYFCYCGRPEDAISVLSYIPVAKVTTIFALLSLILAAGKTTRRYKDLPKEARYLLLMICIFFVSSVFSPVWRGGAFANTTGFAKVYIAWVLTFLLVTTLKRLRRIIFIQAASVIVICLIAVVKGHSVPRLDGVIGGFYSNPNDMAFAIVLSLPFCLAFLLTAKSTARQFFWCAGMLVMATTLVLTASRAGFIDLVVAGTVCLWHFGIKGKRLYLIGATFVLGAALLLVAGRSLMQRFAAISGESLSTQEQETAHASYEERKLLMIRAVDAITHYPLLGVGLANFVIYSGLWKDVHASYLQIAADGGIPILILYLMFFFRGFANLRQLSRKGKLDNDTDLFLGALKGSLVGFVVGACFAPEAYQFFPYFTVCYTSVFFAITKEGEKAVPVVIQPERPWERFSPAALSTGGSSAFKPAR